MTLTFNPAASLAIASLVMRRRDVLAFLVAVCGATQGALAQTRVYRLAWLSGGAVVPSATYDEFVAAMRELGWSEGRNYTVENLRYDGNSERLRAIADEVVQRKFDLIICAGTPPAVAAKNATGTIPIVFYFLGDPIGAGLVASFARPGGNVTGLGGLGPGIYAKMLELLMEAAPATTRIAMLANSTFSLHAGFAADAQAAARRMKVTLRPVEVRSPEDVDRAFATIGRDKPDALLILGQPFLIGQGARLARMAIEQRLPTMAPFEGVVRDGILMSFGNRLGDDVRRLPYYVDRLLKGAQPGDLPVEQPTRFYLTINAKTARAIGLALPASLLRRADEVIE
jgi:putative ABC transport system substrate-binding protein